MTKILPEQYEALEAVLHSKKKELASFDALDKALTALKGLEQRHIELVAANEKLSEAYTVAKQNIEAAESAADEAEKKAAEILKRAAAQAEDNLKAASAEIEERTTTAKDAIAKLNQISKKEADEYVAEAMERKKKIEAEAAALESESAAYRETKAKNDVLSADLKAKEEKLEDVKKQLASILGVGKE